MEGLKKSFLVRGNNIVGFSDKNFSTCPIGTVLSFAGQTAPNGYLLCNGASYKVADYPDLYAVIGNTYGGDTENFNVPNLVDKFIEGSTTSGEEKEAGLPSITGTFYHDPNVKMSLSGAFSYTIGRFINLQNDAVNKNSGYVNFDASKSNPIYGKSTTVQPPALTMVYIIKAFHTNEGVDSSSSSSVSVEELWVNTNTEVPFDAQTVYIPDLSYYKLILFETKYYTTGSNFIVTNLIVNIPQSTIIQASIYRGNKRDIEIKSDSIVFGKGNVYLIAGSGEVSINNNYCIPAKIYGIK